MLKLILFFLTLVKCKNVISGDVYGNSTFPIILRDGSKLKSLVLNSDVAYLVQFFSFTCGFGLESLKLYTFKIQKSRKSVVWWRTRDSHLPAFLDLNGSDIIENNSFFIGKPQEDIATNSRPFSQNLRKVSIRGLRRQK